MAHSRTKLYVFVDESGQDTKGVFFVVGVLITDAEWEALRDQLLAIEEKSGKGNVKWRKARHSRRQAYIEALLAFSHFPGAVCYQRFEGKNYLSFTAHATAQGILRYAGESSEATVLLDGFRETELVRLKRSLHYFAVRTKKVRGVRKEETNALIRLADAICGLVRDARDGWPWAERMLKKLMQRGIVEELE